MKKRIISLLLALTLCLGLLPAPVFAEEAPTNQTLAETPVSQNEEPQEPQPEPAPQNEEGQEPQQEPAPQNGEAGEPQPEPAPQNGEGLEPQGAPEQMQPQGEPEQGEPQGEPEQGEPQGEPEQGEPQEEPGQGELPVQNVLKANAPMAVAEANIITENNRGNLFAGVGGQYSFWVGCDNGDLNSLEAVIKESPPGLSVTRSNNTVTVTATKEAQVGMYDVILTLGKTQKEVSFSVQAPFTVDKNIHVVSDKNSATLTVKVDVAADIDPEIRENIASNISYLWIDAENSREFGPWDTRELNLTPANLSPNPEASAVYSGSFYCVVKCETNTCNYSDKTSTSRSLI